ncbi:MAG: carboxypeptidase-like regulatory domain-containing protein, partial [Candidatus Sericytochromatia bacterium]
KPGFKRAAVTDLAVTAGRPLVLTDAVTRAAGETAGSQLKGLIRDAQGRAVVGASVTATDAKGVGYTGTSDAQGNVAIAGLPDGTYSVQVYRSFYQVPPAKAITLTGGAGGDLGTVTLASTVMHFGKISGRLLDEAGEPIDGAVVQLDPPTTESVFTDARGNFTLDRVMPGEYTLRAAAGGFEVGERDVLVDNQPGFTAAIGDGFVLRQPFDPAKQKPADRKVAQLMPPNAKAEYQGEDLVISWEPVGLPPGIAKVVYDLEGQAAPGAFMNLATTDQTKLILKGFGKGPATFNLVTRPVVSTPAGYRIQGSAVAAYGSTISVGNLPSMDLETAMMAVQSQRAKLLETQLRGQLEAVQSRNEQISRLNQLLGALNALAAIAPPAAGSTSTPLRDALKAVLEGTKAAGISHVQMGSTVFTSADQVNLVAKGDVDSYIQSVKGMIDSAGNTQQMDMLRLQSLSNKRNEAFDLMTNFIKKMADNRSSIIGNMR